MCTPVVIVGVYCIFASGMLVLDDNIDQHFGYLSGSVVNFWCFGTQKIINFFPTSTVPTSTAQVPINTVQF